MKKRLFQRSGDDLPGFLLTLKCTSFSLRKYQKAHHSSVPGSSSNPPLMITPSFLSPAASMAPHVSGLCDHLLTHISSHESSGHIPVYLGSFTSVGLFHCLISSYKQLGPLSPSHLDPSGVRPIWDLFRAMPQPVLPSGLLQTYIASAINCPPNTA